MNIYVTAMTDEQRVQELWYSIRDSEQDQKRYITLAIQENGPDPANWSPYYLGLVCVKAKHIGTERGQVRELTGGDLTWTDQDECFHNTDIVYGDRVDNWPKRNQIEIAKTAKEHYEQTGVTFP